MSVKDWWITCTLKLGRGHSRPWKIFNIDETFLSEKEKGRDVTRTSILATEIWVKMKLPFLYEKIAESLWRAMRVGLQ